MLFLILQALVDVHYHIHFHHYCVDPKAVGLFVLICCHPVLLVPAMCFCNKINEIQIS